LLEYRVQRKKEFRRKLEEHCRDTAHGVNIPQLSQAEMRKIREGLVELFMTIINPMLKELQPEDDDYNDWLAFEVAYKETMHILRLDILKSLKRDPKTLYGERRINRWLRKLGQNKERGSLRNKICGENWRD
jgi:hypothetical protein